MECDVRNKTIFVTGSSSGLGYELAKILGAKGARVLINGKKLPKLVTASKQLRNSDYILGDITSEVSCRKIHDEIQSKYGSLDVLICNLGSGKSVEPGKEDIDEWKRVFDLNFWASIHSIYTLVSLLKVNTNSSIICISSICGLERITGAPITYSVAKSALNVFVQAYAPIIADRGIRINAIVPGNLMFPGSSWDKKHLEDPIGIVEMLNTEVPLKRFGEADEISKAIAFLASDAARFMTGTLLKIDGGQVRSFS